MPVQPNDDICVYFGKSEVPKHCCSVLIHNASQHQDLIEALQAFRKPAKMLCRTFSTPRNNPDFAQVFIQIDNQAKADQIYEILTQKGMRENNTCKEYLRGVANGQYLGSAEIGQTV